MPYILQRNEDGAYVTPPGQKSSYTKLLQHARIFTTREDAEKERCPNERLLSVEELLRVRK